MKYKTNVDSVNTVSENNQMLKKLLNCKRCKGYHHGDLRSVLLSEAEAMIAEGGVQSLSIRELAKRADVSRNAPYRHFKDKHELLSAVAEGLFRKFSALLEDERLQNPDEDPLVQLEKMGQIYLQFAVENSQHYKLMFNEPAIADAKAESFKEAADLSFAVLIAGLERCQTAALINKDPLELQGMFVWSSLHGLASILIDIPCLPVEDLQEMTNSSLIMIRRGIGAKDRSAS